MRSVLALSLLAAPLLGQEDARDVNTGWVLPDEGYCDQPLVVRLDDGTWLAVLTTGVGHEGQAGQHVVTLRSTDQGRTWTAPVELEPADGPEASWAQPLVAPSGRVFVFYVYNDSGITDRRADLLGSFVMRWSDDGGSTWSARTTLPMRVTAIDRENDFGGATLMQWGVSQPLVHRGAVLVPFTKIGEYLVERTEAWFLHSPDLLTTDDPTTARWEVLPDGDQGLRAPGPISSEPCLAELQDGSLACVVRTVDGHPLLATSADGGRTWSEPAPVVDRDGRVVRQPRACVRLWRYGAERYLLWTHEVATPTWAPGTRNPAWIRGGTMVDGALRFGPPEVLLYDPDPNVRISYPDLVLEEGQAYVLETQKTVARTHAVDPALLEALFQDAPRKREGLRGLIGKGAGGQRLLPARVLRGGWTFEGVVELDGHLPTRLARAHADGLTVEVSVNADLALELALESGERRTVLTSEPHVLPPGAPHHVGVVLDLGPGIVRWMVDGRVLDGGETAPRGWARVDVLVKPGVDEKLLLESDERREIELANGDQFKLASPAAPNGLLVPIGDEVGLKHRFGRVSRIGFITTGVGFQPSEDMAQPAFGVVRLRFADGFERAVVWDLRDSTGAGRGARAQVAGPTWTLVRTSDGARWDDRQLYWQSFVVDETRELVEIVFDARVAVDAAGDDAEFAVLAISATSASASSSAPLAPVAIGTHRWNADLLAETPEDAAGRGFRATPEVLPMVREAVQALTRAPLELGMTVMQGAHYGRALLAGEIVALQR